jgi:hypothetical protein
MLFAINHDVTIAQIWIEGMALVIALIHFGFSSTDRLGTPKAANSLFVSLMAMSPLH